MANRQLSTALTDGGAAHETGGVSGGAAFTGYDHMTGDHRVKGTAELTALRPGDASVTPGSDRSS